MFLFQKLMSALRDGMYKKLSVVVVLVVMSGLWLKCLHDGVHSDLWLKLTRAVWLHHSFYHYEP